MSATNRMISCMAILGFGPFGAFGAAPGAPKADSAPAPTPMMGLYASLKPPETEADAAAFLRALEGNPYLTGVLLAAQWNEIEPEEGKYDFSRLDRCVDMVRKAGKQYKFKVMTGIYSPEYIYKTGAIRFDTVIANPNRSNYGEKAAIPVPWDPVFQRHFSRLIKVFGERYASDPQCVAVTLTCANYMSAEMHLPKSDADMKRWAEVGLTTDKLLHVYCQYMDEWAAAFPRQLICLHMSKSTNLPDMSDNEFVEKIVLYGLEKYPHQFALQNNGLNGRKENKDDPDHPLSKFKDRLLNGYQSVASFKTTPERQGSIEMSALNFVRVDAEYWELWEADGMDADICRQVQAAVDEARRLGYDGYKKKLIETGKYRGAADDRWTPPAKGAPEEPAYAPEEEPAPQETAGEPPTSAPEENRSDGRPNKAELMAWVEPDKTEPPGTAYKTFHSKTIDGDVSYLIYLPPDYEKETAKRYPVLYWLHGSGAPQSKGGGIVQRIDQAIGEGKAPPMIIVLVNGLRGATMYSDTKDGKWPLESVIVNDLIPHVDVTYRTDARREMRAVEGFSMGGFGAAHFGFKYPDLFGVVSILAPALLGPDLTDEGLQRKWQEHLSFVFNGDLDAFQANNPFALVEKNADKIRGRSIIRIVPHDGEGSKWLIPRCEELHALLDQHGIANELNVRADVLHHNYGQLYESMGDEGVGFYAKAFGK
ncbi:MAG: alpha/beta hydrolase-fold protein [Candidatus Sumerlaeota bacterium]|nr:alpha/beta hydrolase-fold protein [Candidatus Sumerlaeota bacterium]